MSDFVSRPKCNRNNVEQLSFTWLDGIIGPNIVKHVKCDDCGETNQWQNERR